MSVASDTEVGLEGNATPLAEETNCPCAAETVPGEIGDRAGAIGDRPKAVGDRPGATGAGPGASGDATGPVGDRSEATGERPGAGTAMGLKVDKGAAGVALLAEGMGVGVGIAPHGTSCPCGAEAVPEVIGVGPGAVEDRPGKFGDMPGAGALEDRPGAGAGMGLSMMEHGVGVALPAGEMGAGVKIAPLDILPNVWLAESNGGKVGVLITAGEPRVGVAAPQAGEMGVDWEPKGEEAAAGGCVGGNMLLSINGDKAGVAVGAAEGFNVGSVIGVWPVLSAAVSGVGVGGALCRKEDVGPAVPGAEIALSTKTGCL